MQDTRYVTPKLIQSFIDTEMWGDTRSWDENNYQEILKLESLLQKLLDQRVAEHGDGIIDSLDVIEVFEPHLTQLIIRRLMARNLDDIVVGAVMHIQEAFGAAANFFMAYWEIFQTIADIFRYLHENRPELHKQLWDMAIEKVIEHNEMVYVHQLKQNETLREMRAAATSHRVFEATVTKEKPKCH
jgi:hypothetical protein